MKKAIFCFLIYASTFNVGKAQLSFTDSGQKLGNGISYSIALGDIDSDGDLDAIVANGDYNTIDDVEIWLNDSKGAFILSNQKLSHAKNGSVSLADLNGDKSLDIFLTIGHGGPNKVFFNDGSGNFTDSGQKFGSGTNSGSTGLVDLDGDSDIDVFICIHPMMDGPANPGNEVWLNDGKGFFTNTGQKLGNGWNTGLAIGDVDNDGDIDAITASNNLKLGNKIWLNDGKGNFTESKQELLNLDATSVTLGDLDRDNDLDAYIIYYDYPTAAYHTRIWFNDGKGNFTDSGQKFGTTSGFGIGLGDLDNDNDLDAFVPSGQWQKKGPSKIWINNGKGMFTDSLIIGNDESYDVKFGDLDADGDLDAFVANSGPNKVWLNNINPSTAVKKNEIGYSIMLYPNPTNGHITLSLGTSQSREALVEIYNLQGAPAFSKTFQNTPSATIDLTGNASGIYVVKVIAGGVSYEEKIVKE